MLTFEERKHVLNEINADTMLFLSPEMLANRKLLQRLATVKTGLFVVDEAHCISQWGHEFRTDYLRLKEVIEFLGNPSCLALTATATRKVERDIIGQLEMEDPVIHRYSVNRKHIKFFVQKAETKQLKLEYLQNCLETLETPAIIYAPTRNETISLSRYIGSLNAGLTAYYHGGMSKEDRLLVQHQFLNNELDIICATSAFGMGINKPDIRTVIHMHLPPSAEQFVQEAGRAGRDEAESAAVIIYTDEDKYIPLSFIDQEFPEEHELMVWLRTLKQLGQSNVSLPGDGEMSKILQAEEAQWKMLKYYLEKENILSGPVINWRGISEQLFNKLNRHFTNRKLEKGRKFDDMESLVQGNTCIRSGILRYFDEEKGAGIEKCCSACGLSINDVFSNKNMQGNRRLPIEQNGWKEELAQLLIRPKRRTVT
jgi:ATP-dependent DNA helicase RecQ